ncbi:MAG TPA: hypothetical protein GX743_10870 [Actinomycetales bacterium]|nr:hypothetical protein [Actinomycetales bacterium]
MTDSARNGFTDIVDTVTRDHLAELAGLPGPVASLLMPTRRDVTDTTHDSLVLRNLADEAAAALAEVGADADEILAPVYALVDSQSFWRNQAEGLAIYAHEGGHHVFRLPREVPQVSIVGESARLLPLLRIATGDEAFYLLAVSQNSVRLFDATRNSIHELELAAAPASVEDMERKGTREPQLQHQMSPRGTSVFHGHGGADTIEVALKKFLADVAAGVRAQIGADTAQPIVLAGVVEHLPALQATGQLPTLLDRHVTGNVEHLGPRELLEQAWPLAETRVTERRQEMADRFGEAYGTGTAIVDPDKLVKAAHEGRIGTIIAGLDPEPAGERPETGERPGSGERPETGERPNAADDAAVAGALTTGADIAVAELPDGAPLGALLRY